MDNNAAEKAADKKVPTAQADVNKSKTALTAAPANAPGAASPKRIAFEPKDIPVNAIVPNPDNAGRVDVNSDHYKEIVEGLRVHGTIYQRILVVPHDNGYMIINGEHRWRAGCEAGLAVVPCDVAPVGTPPADLKAAGLITNGEGKQQPYGPIHTARELRYMKNVCGLTLDEVAARTDIARDRVADYASILGSSEYLLTIFEKHHFVLRIAAEFYRYEKATSEASAKKLIDEHLKKPFSRDEIIQARKDAADSRRARKDPEEADEAARPERAPSFVRSLRSAFAKDADTARSQLEQVVALLGYRLVALDKAKTEGKPAAPPPAVG